MVCLTDSIYLRLVLNLLSCGLSLILSILVIFFIIKKGLFRVYSYKILTYISINDSIRSLIGILEFMISENSSLCSLYGFLDFYFFISNPIWALCLSFTIFQIIVLEETSFEKYHKIWVFVNVFVVGGLEALPFITRSYGLYEGYCQLKGDETGSIWRFSLFYLPISIILAINFVLFFRILKKVEAVGIISLRTIVLDRGMIYTLIILLNFIPLLILRIVELFEGRCIAETLLLFMFFIYYSQGFLNGVAFFHNKTIRFIIFQKRDSLVTTMQTDLNSLRISYASDLIN